MSKIKIFCYEFLFIFITNHITNKQLLLVIDLLQIFTLPFLYVNPIFTHLTAQPIFNLYFTQIYPRLYFFKQQTTALFFPVYSTVCTLAMIILIIFRKKKTNFCIMGAQFVLVLLPLFIFRLAAEIVNVFYAELTVKIIGILIVLLNTITIFVILIQYHKVTKIIDLLVGVILFCNINQYVFMALLAVKIFLTYLIPISTPTKTMKLALESSLLISSLLLLFVKPVTINYIMLISLIIISFIYPTFNFVVGLQYTDITTIKREEDDAYCLNEYYSINQLEFFKKINRHIPNCVNLQCKCREVMRINSLNDLKQWIPGYIKKTLKIAIEGSEGEDHKISDKQLYDKQIEYIKFCVDSSQDLDFQGFLRLHKLIPKNSIQQYQKYHYMKRYSLVLQKTNPKALKMNIVNYSEQSSPYNDFMKLETKISIIIAKIQIFWKQLLKVKVQKNHQFVSLIEQISRQVEQINRMYEEIQLNYDQKQEAEYYYNIFRLLVLQQKPSPSIFIQHETNYVIVSSGNQIKNITANITHLVQKTRQNLIGHNYTSLMLPIYANWHSEWIRKYFQGYRILEQVGMTKTIALTPQKFKVVKMTHMLMPNFPSHQTFEQNDKQNEGVHVATLISTEYKQMEQQNVFRKEIAFHLLVSRETLDIIAYEPAIFDYFNEKETIDNANKLLRANLKKIFPNLNRETIINNKTGKILIAREDPDFFSADEETGYLVDKEINAEATELVSTIRSLQISEVPSIENKSLDLLLLGFEYLIQKEQKNKLVKNSEKHVSRHLDHETLQNILEGPEKIEDEKQKDPEKDLRKLEVIQSVSILLIFGVFASIFVLFEIQHLKLGNFMAYYDKKAEFYTDLSLTQLYFQNFHAGKNRLKQMEQYWSYNEEYTDIMTIFTSISEEAFRQKFQSYIKLFQKRLAFEELSEKLLEVAKKFSGISWMTTIMFWGSFILIVVNFLVSLTIFIKNQMSSVSILSIFLCFKEEQIKFNLKKLKLLEKNLEILQYRPKNEDESAIDVQDEQKTLEIPVQHEEITESKKKRKRRPSESGNKQKLEIALKSHFNNYQQMNETGDLSRMKIIKKDQINLSNPPIQSKKSHISQPENEQKNSPFSLINRIYKNIRYFSPIIIGLTLKLSIALTLWLFITNLISSTTKCLQFKHQLFYEPVYTLNKLQIQYFSNKKQNITLIQYEFNNRILLKQLPMEFDEFRAYSASLSSTINPLCSFINRTNSQNLYQRCLNCDADIFDSGIQILIQFIQEQFRQIRVGYIPKEYLKEENTLSLAIEVLLELEYERNQVYAGQLQSFYEKYSNIKNLIRIILVSVFLICIYLQIKQFNLAKTRKNQTQNLLKIVPKFMKKQIPDDK